MRKARARIRSRETCVAPPSRSWAASDRRTCRSTSYRRSVGWLRNTGKAQSGQAPPGIGIFLSRSLAHAASSDDGVSAPTAIVAWRRAAHRQLLLFAQATEERMVTFVSNMTGDAGGPRCRRRAVPLLRANLIIARATRAARAWHVLSSNTTRPRLRLRCVISLAAFSCFSALAVAQSKA